MKACSSSSYINSLFFFFLLLLLQISLSLCLQFPNKHHLGFCSHQQQQHLITTTPMATLGGIKHSEPSSHNTLELDSLARFAVDQHNQKQNALLEFARVVKAKEQVVAGTLHHLTLEVIDAGTKKLYEAKVWVKPWLNFKELQEFKHVEDCPLITPSDLGVKKGDHPPGWQSVPVHDPVVQDAADHAIKTIQQRSNSLIPYQLQEIVHANVEVIEESAKFDILLKVSRGDKEEKLKVEVHKNDEGTFKLNHMAPHNE